MRPLLFLAGLLLALAAQAQPSSTKTYAVNDRGQVTAITDPAHSEADTTFTYDENGNRLTKTQGSTEEQYTWDARNRLIALWRNGGLVARYDYHWTGLRASKETFGPGASLIRFDYDGPWLLSESNVLRNTLTRYHRDAQGRLRSIRRNVETRQVITDGIGTPIALLTYEGATVARFRFDVWGNRVEAEGVEQSPMPMRHSGHYFDEESGLYYLGARYYDPALGAFISEDPAEGKPEEPITSNPYVAFGANPATYGDPDGRQFQSYASTAEAVALAQMARDRGELRQGMNAYSAGQQRTALQTASIAATAYIGGGLASAARAGWSAARASGWAWGVAVGTTRAVPFAEAGAQLAANVPGPGYTPTPMPSAAAAAARTEAMVAEEARAASMAGFADDVPAAVASLPDPPPLPPQVITDALPPPGLSTAKASMVVEASNGGVALIPPTGSGPVGARAPPVPPAYALSMETGPYRVMKNRDDIPGQAHHLNQDAMYRDKIAHPDGLSLKLEGDAFREPGTPHYIVHQVQEAYLKQFRPKGARYPDRPSNLEMNRTMLDALRAAGYTTEQAKELVQRSMQQRLDYGLLGGQQVPRIPGRINQVPPPPPASTPDPNAPQDPP